MVIIKPFVRLLKEKYWSIRADLRHKRFPYLVRRLQHKFSTEFAYLALAHIFIKSILVSSFRKRPKSKKNLLLLAWLFPPMISGGVYRPTALVKYARKTNWNISVIAGPMPTKPSDAGKALSDQIPKEIKVQYLGGARWKSDLERPWEIDGGIINAVQVFKEAKNICNSEPPAIVMASGPPFHNFIAATLLSYYFKARLVLEYRDEWSECPFEFVKKNWVSRQWESWCLTKADLVVFTTQSQLEHQKKIFSQLEGKKCVVIPNGWDSDDFIMISEKKLRLDTKNTLTLAYFGNLWLVEELRAFLQSLTKVLDNSPQIREVLKIKFVGIKNQACIKQITNLTHPGIIEIIDQVPKPDACKMMSSVDALLLFNSISFNRYIPGKTYDYIASKTPILAFGEGYEVAQIIKNLGIGIVIPFNDIIALEHALKNIKFFKIEIDRNKRKIDNWLKARRRDILALETFKNLDQLLNE